MKDKDAHLLAHEELCAERYENINKTLSTILTSQTEQAKELKNITAITNRGRGAWWVILTLGGLVGFISTILGIAWLVSKLSGNN